MVRESKGVFPTHFQMQLNRALRRTQDANGISVVLLITGSLSPVKDRYRQGCVHSEELGWMLRDNLILWHIWYGDRQVSDFLLKLSKIQLLPLLASSPFPTWPPNCSPGICNSPASPEKLKRCKRSLELGSEWARLRDKGPLIPAPNVSCHRSREPSQLSLGCGSSKCEPSMHGTPLACLGLQGEKPHISKWLLQVASYYPEAANF